MRDVRDLVDRALERILVCLRRLGRSADLADVLKSCGVHLFFIGGWLKIVEGVDVSAHANEISRRRRHRVVKICRSRANEATNFDRSVG